MVPVSKNAPIRPVAVATVSDSTSVVIAVQLPSAFCVAPGIVQPVGRLFIVVIMDVPAAAELVRARFMGSPAVPAGAGVFGSLALFVVLAEIDVLAPLLSNAVTVIVVVFCVVLPMSLVGIIIV